MIYEAQMLKSAEITRKLMERNAADCDALWWINRIGMARLSGRQWVRYETLWLSSAHRGYYYRKRLQEILGPEYTIFSPGCLNATKVEWSIGEDV